MIERSTVEQWLRETDLEIGEVELEDGDDSFAWHLAFKGGPFATVVAHRKMAGTHLLMQVSLNVADEHRAVLRELDADTRDRFMFDLRIILHQQPVGHSLAFEEEDSSILTSVTIALNAYEDDLGKAGFLRRNHKLQSTGQLVVQMIRKLVRFKDW